MPVPRQISEWPQHKKAGGSSVIAKYAGDDAEKNPRCNRHEPSIGNGVDATTAEYFQAC